MARRDLIFRILFVLVLVLVPVARQSSST